MKIATWNINGVKARLHGLIAWLKAAGPDIVCLQEIKSVDEGFPREPLEALGYNVATHGQKGFNGVAILSRLPFDETISRLPGDEEDGQARYLEAVISLPGAHAGRAGGGALRIASLYLPNGNPVDSDKFAYKLAWMARLEAHVRALLRLEEVLVLAGDYNVIPAPEDVHDPAAWADDALFRPESRAAFRRLVHLGLTDALRATDDSPGLYTFWDYQGGAWRRNNGIRIDHMLLSPQAADRLEAAGIDKQTRGWEKPSDHVPVWMTIDTA